MKVHHYSEYDTPELLQEGDQITVNWDAVTCEQCLKVRPAPMPSSPWAEVPSPLPRQDPTRALFTAAPEEFGQAAVLAAKGGRKDDQSKTRVELLPTEALIGAAKVLTHGALKYETNNWRKGLAWTRVIGAALRHIFAIMRGEDTDPESGLPHVDHALCELMFLSTFQKTGTGDDDRYTPKG